MSTIVVSGASGFIGSRLAKSLTTDGHRVVRLARRQTRPVAGDVIRWDPESGQIDSDALGRVSPDAVVNFAGEPIGQRWTAQRRREIRDSRVKGTTLLAQAIASLPRRPSVLVSGSAMGYYGAHRGDELLDEESPAGSDFLAQTAREWEQATEAAADAGIRVVLSRTGLVLGADGGVLGRMLLPFRLGLGGRLGTGHQWMSWISLDDMVRAIRFVLESESLRGPVNMATPGPVQNTEFTRTLAGVLGRPAVFPVPSIVLELLFGTMADNTLLASQRMVPKRLAGAGFEFRHPRLDEALRFELTR
jgi:uncharacterized protein (TIGR01777 family)